MTLGIDLGTTYSAGAYVDEEGEAHVVVNREGKRTTPSVFFEESEGKILIGEIAKEYTYIRPKDVVSVVKNHMGTKELFETSTGNKYNPEEISSYIIRKMVQDAESYIGKGKINDVVITIPAYFDDSQRKATEDAAKIAGVNLVGIINEPTAAMLSYAHRTGITKGNYMIYDLGGGTFDVSIVNIEGEKITVLSTDGAKRTGGFYFDQLIVKYVVEELLDKYSIDLEDETYIEELNELYKKAENCKIQLSSTDKAFIPMKVDNVRATFEITRELFESKITRLYRNTEAKVKNAIRNAGITASEIDAVLMVGGSSRIPLVENKVRALVGKEPARDINPDEAVAIGAAIFGDMKNKNTVKRVIQDTSSHGVGFVITKEDGRTKENYVLIGKNTSLPAAATQKVITIEQSQQKIDLEITEGEVADLPAVKILDKIEIKLPANLKKGTEVNVTYQQDEYQLLHIFIDIPAVPNWAYEHKLQRISNLSEEEIKHKTGIALQKEVN